MELFFSKLKAPFVLCLSNSSAGLAALSSVASSKLHCVLVPKHRLPEAWPRLAEMTGITRLVEVCDSEVDRQGGLVVSDLTDAQLEQSDHSNNRGDVTRWVEETPEGAVGLLTSATTGQFKVAISTWNALFLQAEETIRRLGDNLAPIIPSPIGHAYGINAVLASMCLKTPVGIPSSPQHAASQMNDFMQRGYTPMLMGSPLFYENMSKQSDLNMKLNSGRCIAFSAGCAIKQKPWETLHNQGLSIRSNYGSSETGIIAAALEDPSCWQGLAYCDGTGPVARCWGKVQLHPLDPTTQGAALHPVHQNELVVNVPWMAMGYATSSGFERIPRMYKTGDAGSIDRAGNVVVAARLRECLNINPFHVISPLQLEILGREVASVEEIACVAHPRKQTVIAAVQPQTAVAPVYQHLRQHLDAELLEYISFVGVDAMPKSAAGKIIIQKLINS